MKAKVVAHAFAAPPAAAAAAASAAAAAAAAAAGTGAGAAAGVGAGAGAATAAAAAAVATAATAASAAAAAADLTPPFFWAATDGATFWQGEKQWISNAKEADIFFVFANADPSKGYKGITCFVVEKGERCC